MTTQDDALANIAASGLAAVLKWAAPVAFARTREDYDEDAGHDQFIIGGHNFVYLRDLLDRATSNKRFAVNLDSTGSGDDVLSRGITAAAFATMPVIEPGLIVRKDFEQSPGWAAGDIRVLLQSFKYGQIDRIQWARPAKKKVANLHFLTSVPLFDDEEFGLDPQLGIPDDDDFAGTTLVGAHSFDPATGQYELFVGQSKLTRYRGDLPWHWREPLLLGGMGPSATIVETEPTMPGSAPSGNADEIVVQVKQDKRREAGLADA